MSKDHIYEIGRLVVEVSRLEAVMTDLVGAFAGMAPIAAIITVHHQQLASKADTLLALYRLGNDEIGKGEEEDRLIALIERAKKVADFRNTVVHTMWIADEKGSVLAVKFTARGKLRRTRTPAGLEETRAQADQAAEIVQRLASLRDHLLEEPQLP